MEIEKKEKRGRYLLYLAAMLIPCLYMLLWYFIQGHGFLAGKPYYSDELGYWRVMFSFDNCGFDFGPGEFFVGYPPTLGSFGSHGLSTVLAWGWYALLFPWRDNSIFVADFIALTLSIAVFLLLVKPKRKEMLLIIPTLLLFAPMFLYINTCMMEIPCTAAIIVYSGLYLRWREKREKSVFVLALLTGAFLALLRICYVIVLVPLLWEKWEFKYNVKAIAGMLCFAAAVLVMYRAEGLFMSLYPGSFEEILGNIPGFEKLRVLAMHTLKNIRIYFLGMLSVSEESVFRWLYMAVLCLFAFRSLRGGEKKRLYFSFTAIYAALLAATFLMYDIGSWRDYRSMFPALIFALLFIAVDRDLHIGVKYTVLAALAVMFALTLIPTFRGGEFVHPERFEKSADNRASFAEVFGEEKTSVAVMSEDGVFDRLRDIPPQIGVQWMFDEGGVIDSDTGFIMIGGDDREVAPEYEFAGRPAEKCYVYRRIGLDG